MHCARTGLADRARCRGACHFRRAPCDCLSGERNNRLDCKRLIKIDTVTIVNLVLGRKLIPEFLQDKCQPGNITPVLDGLLGDSPIRQEQKDGFDEACHLLGVGGRAPSEKAAEQILKIIAKK